MSGRLIGTPFTPVATGTPELLQAEGVGQSLKYISGGRKSPHPLLGSTGGIATAPKTGCHGMPWSSFEELEVLKHTHEVYSLPPHFHIVVSS